MKRFLNFAVFALMFCWHAGAQEPRSLTGTEAEGYRGIWFTIGQARSGFGPKYSGGLGTYTMKHIPVAVYAAEADKTFFVYGGTPAADRKYLLCTVGCYDHKTGMLRRPVVVCDKGVNNVHDPHDDPTIQIDKEGYVWIFVAGRGNTRPGIRYRSRKPYDISAFDYVNESIMAYPQVHYHPDEGFFLFFTRYDGKRRLFYQSSPDGIEWTDYRPLASIMEPGETKSGHYQFSTLCGKKLMCCFNRHIDGNCDTRTNIYYIQSEELGPDVDDGGRTPGHASRHAPERHLADPGFPVRTPQLLHQGHQLRFRRQPRDPLSDQRQLPDRPGRRGPKLADGPLGRPAVALPGPDDLDALLRQRQHLDRRRRCLDRHRADRCRPSILGTGGEMVMWRSRDKGQSWQRVRALTHDSPRNHSYARRPVHAHPDFYAFWADGDPDNMSISRLYFCNERGDLFRMPYTMQSEWQKPEPIPGGRPRD